MDLPAGLMEFSRELAARLVLLDEPGVEVKRLRERHGFTQEQLAPLLHLTRESLSRIESGHVTPTRAFMARFTRLMTLAKGARDHIAYMEARDGFPDEHHLGLLAQHLRVEPAAAEEVFLAAAMSYEQKRRETLAGLGGGRPRAVRRRNAVVSGALPRDRPASPRATPSGDTT